MTTYEAISLVVMSSMFVVTLISLIVTLIRETKKGKKIITLPGRSVIM